MKSIQLMLLGFLACFFGPLSFGLVEDAPIGGGTTDAEPETLNPPADNNVSAEDVEDPLPPDEKKSDDSDRVEENIKADPLADVPATTVA